MDRRKRLYIHVSKNLKEAVEKKYAENYGERFLYKTKEKIQIIINTA